MSGWQQLHTLFTEQAPPDLTEPDDPYLFSMAVDSVVAGSSAGWSHLHTLFSERQPAWVGSQCPNDGFVLLPHKDQLRCPFDGWTGGPDEAMPPGTTPPRVVPAGYGLTPYGLGGYGE